MFSYLKYITPRTRLLMVAFLLILVPGAVISYLSLQSIREKAENLSLSYSGTADLVRDKLENEILGLELVFKNRVVEQNPVSAQYGDLKAWLLRMESEFPAYENMFLVRTDGGIISSLISLGSQNSTGSYPLFSASVSASVKKAENAEFINRNYPEALWHYRNAMKASGSDQELALLLLRTGRCYSKQGDYKSALQEFRKILSLGDPQISIGNVPAHVVAQSQLAETFKAMSAENERIEALVDLYKLVIDDPWDLDGGDYLFYLNNISAEIHSLIDSFTYMEFSEIVPGDLMNKEANLRRTISFMDFLQKNVLPELDRKLNLGSLSELSPVYQTWGGDDSTFRISYMRLPAAFQQKQLSILGFQSNREYLLSSFIPEVLASVELGNNILVGIMGNQDSVLYMQQKSPLESYLVAENLHMPYEDWKVALFHPAGKTIEQLIGKEKQLYLALFMGILAVMIVGVLLVVRAVIQETELSRMKSDFVSNVSHELKTPLALIRMFGETLDSGIVQDEEKKKGFYRIIRKESERLSHLINNVLDFSRMDASVNEYHFLEVDLVETVRSSLDAYKYHLTDKGFKVEVDLPEEPVLLNLDRDSIAQVIINLVNNAVKYSDENKHIQVKIWKTQQAAFLSVKDQGIGISKSELDMIFNKFYRVSDPRIKETRGSGLGLPLAKHIVKAHGGSIFVESEPGRGSTFTLTLPLIREEHC